MTGPRESEDEVTLRTLLALVETAAAIEEHGHDPLSRGPDREIAEARLRARLAAGGRRADPVDDHADRLDDLDLELWLMLEGASAGQYAAGPGVRLGPLRAADPESGAVVVVRAGAEAGSWSVSLSKVAAGRYRVALGHGTKVLGEVELEARAGTTVRATVPGAGPAPDRVRVRRIADGA